MDPVTIAIILSAIGAIGGIGSTIYSNIAQKKRDISADERQLANEKELMEYQAQIAKENNTVATQKGHMAEAGYSPALMYGNATIPGLQDSSGSAQGTSSEFKMPEIFNRVSPDNVYNAVVTNRAQEMQRQRLASDIQLNMKRGLREDAETARLLWQTGMNKKMERTIMDQMTADLALTRSQSNNLNFLTQRGQYLLPGELESQGLINRETAKRIEKIDAELKKNPYEIKMLQADIKRINAVTKLTEAQTSATYTQEEYTREEMRGVQENIRHSAIGRIMKEFGLTQRVTPAALRTGSWLHNKAYAQQIQGAVIELMNLGFSEHEAINACVYYVAEDPKSVTPSLVNGVSRVLVAGIKKK